MADDHMRSISTKTGEVAVHVILQKNPVDGDPPPSGRGGSERKFNIRIKQDDISLLDALTKKQGITRSALINIILHDILRDELMSIDDLDARVLLASRADELASYDDLAQPWTHDALGVEFHSLLSNVLTTSTLTGQPIEFGMPSGHQVSETDYRSAAYLGLFDKLTSIAH